MSSIALRFGDHKVSNLTRCGPTDRLQPALFAIGAAATNQSGLSGLLQRRDGFMRLANLAAEARGRWLVIRPDDAADLTLTADLGSSMG